MCKFRVLLLQIPRSARILLLNYTRRLLACPLFARRHDSRDKTVVRRHLYASVRIRARTVAMIRIMMYARMRGTFVSMSRRSPTNFATTLVVKTKLGANARGPGLPGDRL